MVKNKRKQSLVEKSKCFIMMGKRYCELNKEELRIYNNVMKNKSRRKPEIIQREAEYHKEYMRRKINEARRKNT